MPQVAHSTTRATLILLALLPACSTTGSVANTNGLASVSSQVASSSQRKDANTGSLYISSLFGSVVEYGGPNLKYIRAITGGGQPHGIAFNSRKQLFVVKLQLDAVDVFKSNGKVIRSISQGFRNSDAIVVSSRNDVYIRSINHVTIVRNGGVKGHKNINKLSGSLAIDHADNFYLGDKSSVYVFPPGTNQPARTITQGLVGITAMAVDTTGNLYVGNVPTGGCGDINVYNTATGLLESTISDSVCYPDAFAFDSQGNLYSSDWKNQSVTEYAAGTGALLRTITQGIGKPADILIDRSDNLYVANASNPGSVTVYAPNKTSPSRTLTKNVNEPTALAWLPSGN